MNKPAAAGGLEGIRTVLITGGNGFVGRHLAARLNALGKTVRSVSRSSGFNIVRDEVPIDGVNHVFHLAGRTLVTSSWDNPLEFLQTNGYGTAKLAEQCRRRGCSLTLLSSYLDGNHLNPEPAPIGESVNPYAFSKRVAEEICRFYALRFGCAFVTLKLSNIYGPGQDPSFLIPHIVAQLVEPATAEIVVENLAPCRDYLYIDDAVDGLLRSVGASPGSIFDLGSGTSHSVEEVILIALEAADIYKPYRGLGARRLMEIDGTAVDFSHAHQVLGWQPQVSLRAGLLSMIESIRR